MRRAFSHEIIVVNDGSTDDTLARARETGVQVVNFPHNGGYGQALKAGIAVSPGRSLQSLMPMEHIRRHICPEMIAMATYNDMVVGDRGQP
ncbi:MAG: glycosyltransferase [Sphingomonadales bacterium]|nr:glycosyltransferase [Sphingomonadales bacterium]